MTTEDIILHIYYLVDQYLPKIQKHPQSFLSSSNAAQHRLQSDSGSAARAQACFARNGAKMRRSLARPAAAAEPIRWALVECDLPERKINLPGDKKHEII
jgi:hypothetical protein